MIIIKIKHKSTGIVNISSYLTKSYVKINFLSVFCINIEIIDYLFVDFYVLLQNMKIKKWIISDPFND